MKGRLGDSDDSSDFLGGRGIGMGILGLIVAEVGSGGRERSAGVSPGINNVTTLSTARAFCIQGHFWVRLDREEVDERLLGANLVEEHLLECE